MAEVINTRGDSFTRFGRRIVLMLASSYAFGVESTAADVELGEQTAPFLAVTATGANRALTFSAAVERDGAVQVVYNAGPTYSLVIKNSAASTLITLAPGELVALVYDATAWAVLWKVTASSVPTISPTAISLTDNSATALVVSEGANPYLTFDTANSSESVRIHKILELLAGGIDMSQGAAGQSVYLKDNEAAALDVTEAANSYLKFVTTNSAEKVVVGKLLSLMTGALFADSAASPTVEGQLLYNVDHLELYDGTGARNLLMSDDIGATVQAYSAVLAALATYGLDLQVTATIAVADSATDDAALTLQLNRLDGSTAIASARQVMILTSTTQYAPAGQPEASVTFGTATVGSIIASGQGWCLAKTSATGAFACTATNTDNETIYFFTQTAARVSVVAEGCDVVASNTDAATWS